MGIYTISCEGCSNKFTWFSGSADQFCDECKKPKSSLIDQEKSESDHLNHIIKLQANIIDLLKAEIERLKGSTHIYIPNQVIPSPIIGPGQHNPFIAPYPTPDLNPFIVTCGDVNPGSGGTNPTK
jgi:hypothetical protein